MKTKNYVSGFILLFIAGFCVTVSAQKTNVTVKDLPKNSQEFLTKNFADVNISNVWKDVEKTSTEYEVQLENSIEIEFDQNGNLKEIENKTNSALNGSYIPQNITAYVSKNYAGKEIVKYKKEKNKMEVELNDDTELEFDGSGNFLRIDQ